MKNKQLTIIIPVYNQAKNVMRCINSLKKQTIDFYEMEIILINDGSIDESGDVCRKLIRRYHNIIYFEQENRGVSAARNLGICNAKGKYIFYLDADDQITPETMEKVIEFFDSVYDETDLVTYRIETIMNKQRLTPHFRYQFLQESGVYDLRQHPFIGQTTMNIVVKNRFADNVLFDETQTFSEDQRYCCDVLKDKLKMGFCKEGCYLYFRSATSASGRLAGSCYIFEQCMAFFEQLFADYEYVPLAFQGLYVNDLYWKLLGNILLPYHYEKSEYSRAVDRICRLLQKCDNEVIWNHPHMDFFEKYYLLRLKGKDNLQCHVTQENFCLFDKNRLLVREQSMEMVITKIRIRKTKVEISGFLKTVFFQFYDRKPILCAVENGGRLTRKLNIFPSAHSYYLSHEKTQRFWGVRYEFDVNRVKDVAFEVEVGNCWFPVHYYFMPLVPFSHEYKRYSYRCGGVKLRVDKRNHFIAEFFQEVQQRRIWLYYDCAGVERDNGLLQFQHDIAQQDGVERYYVVSDPRQRKYLGKRKYTVSFGSRKHKQLFLMAEKVITAYIEENNIIPFPAQEYDCYAGKFHFEIIYLQHGVLHIRMPWKYTSEKIQADYIVVSTVQETQLWKENGFRDTDLWKTCMPRFELLNKNYVQEKKILFAPSWRSYLVGNNEKGKWQSLEEKFLASAYYQRIVAFLDSPVLERILREKGYRMEVKLHPIFEQYKKFFSSHSEYITFIDGIQEEGEYSLMITDFSSYMYDFVYLRIPVLSFIPDLIEFKSGMNGYRDLNYTAEYWKYIETMPEGIIERLRFFLDGQQRGVFQADFFEDTDIRKHIYQHAALGGDGDSD